MRNLLPQQIEMRSLIRKIPQKSLSIISVWRRFSTSDAAIRLHAIPLIRDQASFFFLKVLIAHRRSKRAMTPSVPYMIFLQIGIAELRFASS